MSLGKRGRYQNSGTLTPQENNGNGKANGFDIFLRWKSFWWQRVQRPTVTGCRYEVGGWPIRDRLLSGVSTDPNGEMRLLLLEYHPIRYLKSRLNFYLYLPSRKKRELKVVYSDLSFLRWTKFKPMRSRKSS